MKMRKLRHSVVQKAYQCEFCHVKCRRPQDLRRHSFVHTEASFQCDGCGNKFTRYDTLMRHKRDNCRNSQSSWPEKRKSAKHSEPMSTVPNITPKQPEDEELVRAKRHWRQQSGTMPTTPTNTQNSGSDPATILHQYSINSQPSYTVPLSENCPEQSSPQFSQYSQPWFPPQLSVPMSPNSATNGVLNMVPNIIPNYASRSPLSAFSGLASNPQVDAPPRLASNTTSSMAPTVNSGIAFNATSTMMPNASVSAADLPNIVPGIGVQMPSNSSHAPTLSITPSMMPSMASSMGPSMSLTGNSASAPGRSCAEPYAASTISPSSGSEDLLPSNTLKRGSQPVPSRSALPTQAYFTPATPPIPTDLSTEGDYTDIQGASHPITHTSHAQNSNTGNGIKVSPYQSQKILSVSPPYDSSSQLPRIQTPRIVNPLSSHKNNQLQPLEPDPLKTGSCCVLNGSICSHEDAN